MLTMLYFPFCIKAQYRRACKPSYDGQGLQNLAWS